MVRKDLYAAVQREINGNPAKIGFSKPVSYAKAKAITEAVLDVLAVSIRDEDKVFISKFGIFKHVTRKCRRVLIPKTGEEVFVPEKSIVTFDLSKDFCKGIGEEDESEEEIDDDNYFF